MMSALVALGVCMKIVALWSRRQFDDEMLGPWGMSVVCSVPILECVSK